MNLFHSLALSLLETHLNKRNHLGEHQCCRRTLDNTKDDQRESIGGKAAAARKQGEASHAQDEHPFASVEITHAATSDQQDGKRKSIASDHQLELSEAGMQGALDSEEGDKPLDQCLTCRLSCRAALCMRTYRPPTLTVHDPQHPEEEARGAEKAYHLSESIDSKCVCRHSIPFFAKENQS